ncbi:MAG: 3-oxoacyl-[acyl-carrier-protein] reductase [Chlamydiales bacterium]|nr:3-oxoacyl-[acyl-carrier-protein] reductase [Chlamydiales bacterium]
MQYLLKGKKAIVTGGTSGIGKEIAIVFAQHGADVAIVGTNEERAKATLAEMQENKVSDEQKFTYHILDVANTALAEEAVNAVIKEWGQLDILINNAGITRDTLLMRMKEEDWDAVINTNLKSIFNFCKAAVRPMMKQRSGKIVNVSSVVGLTGNAGQSNYAASKLGMVGFTRSLAKEVASRGINVNCIAPGYIKTPMTGALNEEQTKAIADSIPMGMGEPKMIADAALFLASEMSDYITGVVLPVDGGMTC